MRVALVGLGAMGTGMAARLAASGALVTAWTRSGRPAPAGVASAATIAESAEGADAAVVVVTDDDASRQVWLGEGGLAASLASGALAVDASTLSPARVTELAGALAERGHRFVEAPVVGSLPQLAAGSW